MTASQSGLYRHGRAVPPYLPLYQETLADVRNTRGWLGTTWLAGLRAGYLPGHGGYISARVTPVRARAVNNVNPGSWQLGVAAVSELGAGRHILHILMFSITGHIAI